MWVVMSAAEREEFLAGVRVGVLSAAVGTAGRTLAVPVWYSSNARCTGAQILTCSAAAYSSPTNHSGSLTETVPEPEF